MTTELKEEVSNPVEETSSPEAAATSGSPSESGEATQGQSEEAAAPDAKDGAPTEETAEGESEKPAPVFVPKDKFRVRRFGSDEQTEHDVPAWMKAAIKDPAMEKEAISILAKAYGIESIQQARTQALADRDTYKGELSKVQKTIVEARQTYQRGDIDAFLDKLSIPQERMLQWALDKVNYSQLPPEQQRMIDDRREAQRQAWSAEQRASMTQEQFHEQVRTAKQTLLNASLTRPDVQSFAEAYDARVGKPNAFFEEVRATGELAWIQSQGKVDLSPDQAIEQVMKKWSPFLGQAAPGVPAATAASQAGPGVTATPASKPAVIPNVQGRPTTPLKSKPRSVEDLRKLGAAANA